MTSRVVVRLKSSLDRSYTVTVRAGLLKELPGILARTWKGRRLFVITDANVRRLYGSPLLQALTALGSDALLLDFPAGERSKNADVVFSLHSAILDQGIGRDSVILALGGGVVGDVAGFVAATILRGVKYVQVPTTLLAQVDSSVGGKVGIDHAAGKNLIGSFHQPSAVFIDPLVLRTLPAAEFRSGLAEVVKIAAALDKPFFGRIERERKKILALHPGALSALILRAVALKSRVVAEDEFETGLRKILNLGHTIGHALEAASGYSMRHGEAVAAGMASELHIAVMMGLLKPRDKERIVGLLKALKLRSRLPALRDRQRFSAALALDKKSERGAPKFVLLRGIGHAVIGVEVPTPFIAEAVGVAR